MLQHIICIASHLLAWSMEKEAMYSGFTLIHQQWNSNPYHSSFLKRDALPLSYVDPIIEKRNVVFEKTTRWVSKTYISVGKVFCSQKHMLETHVSWIHQKMHGPHTHMLGTPCFFTRHARKCVGDPFRTKTHRLFCLKHRSLYKTTEPRLDGHQLALRQWCVCAYFYTMCFYKVLLCSFCHNSVFARKTLWMRRKTSFKNNMTLMHGERFKPTTNDGHALPRGGGCIQHVDDNPWSTPTPMEPAPPRTKPALFPHAIQRCIIVCAVERMKTPHDGHCCTALNDFYNEQEKHCNEPTQWTFGNTKRMWRKGGLKRWPIGQSHPLGKKYMPSRNIKNTHKQHILSTIESNVFFPMWLNSLLILHDVWTGHKKGCDTFCKNTMCQPVDASHETDMYCKAQDHTWKTKAS